MLPLMLQTRTTAIQTMDGARVEGARLLYKHKLLRRWETVGLLQLVPRNMWGFPLLGVPQNGRFTTENLLKLMIWWYPMYGNFHVV